MRSIVFICSSSKREGLGHFIRCFNIASGINNLNSKVNIYFDGDFCKFALSKIKNQNFKLIEEKKRYIILKKSILIFDSYFHDQKKIKEFTTNGLISIKIDDFNKYNLSGVDCVINFRAGAENEVYNSSKSLLGLKYYPFPKDLIQIRRKNIIKLRNKESIQKNNILVFIGGDDRFNIAKTILKKLDTSLNQKTFFWIRRKQNQQEVILKNNILKEFDLQDNMSNILKDIDCVICGGGLIKYDCGFSLIPCGSISQTAEQEIDSHICSSKNIIYNFGMYDSVFKKDFSSSLNKFLDDSNLSLIKENMAKQFISESNINLAKELIKYC